MEDVPDAMARARPPAVSILHLSDIHRTVDERVENEELLGGLKSDLEAHAADGVPRPQLVVVSGDLTQSAEPREYAQALQFLDKLAAHLALPRARVVVVPGNHDVHWPSSEEAFYLRRSRPAKSLEDLVIELDGRFLCAQGEGPYQRRLANFRDFYRAFTGDPYPEARAGQFTIHTFDELGVAINPPDAFVIPVYSFSESRFSSWSRSPGSAPATSSTTSDSAAGSTRPRSPTRLISSRATPATASRSGTTT